MRNFTPVIRQLSSGEIYDYRGQNEFNGDGKVLFQERFLRRFFSYSLYLLIRP